mgnify:CR=1 FL=1
MPGESPMSPVRIPVGGGSPEGENSAYLLPERGLLVDPGPPGEDAWAALRDGIAEAGCDLETVDDVFLTHWHADHVGLAVRLAEAAGATLSMHADDAPLVGNYAAERRRRLERDARRLRDWGVPDDLVESLRSADAPSPLPEEYPVDAVSAGAAVAGLDVVHLPGHTLGHAGLADEARGDLFVGDAVLPTYTPNVGGGDTRMADPLSSYLDALDRIASLGWTGVEAGDVRLYPGHGTTVAFPDRIEAIRDHHGERTERVLGLLDAGGPATPWAVATELFGEMRGYHAKMGAGEAAAHLVRLRREGRVALVGQAPERYAPADDR